MPHAADRIRNVALVGHRGSGKTSLHEALLFEAGATTRLGTVADGTTVSDSDEDEKARGMSISAALASFSWRDVKVNLIDTPGERKSTRLNSSHANISYAVFCLKKKKIYYPRRAKEAVERNDVYQAYITYVGSP